jgi:hypothetical protein
MKIINKNIEEVVGDLLNVYNNKAQFKDGKSIVVTRFFEITK